MVQVYEEYLVYEKALDVKEKEYWKKALDLEKEKTALEKKRADTEADRALYYEGLYKAATKKKGGIKCFLKRFFTAGLARC
jgi:hypothetical protein